jgi:hypothetical protein
MIQMDTPKVAKVAEIFNCIKCDYNTCRKSNFDKHLATDKHKKHQNDTNGYKKVAKVAEDKKISCVCGKSYTHKQNMYRHKKTCNLHHMSITEVTDEVKYKDMFIEMINQNKTLQSTLIDLIPKINTTNNINNTINNNQKINIKIFLNDTCKDAISMGDFIKTIQVSANDLLFTKNKGLTEGISNIFIEHLNKIPLIQRPLWCSDKKRKRLFIKNDEWVEDEDNLKTKDAIKQVCVLQSKNINKYVKDKPNWMSNDYEKEVYLDIIKTTTESVDDKTEKVIDNLINKIHLTNDTREMLVS